MHAQKLRNYEIYCSDKSDGPFFLDARLPVFSEWIVPSQIHSNHIVTIETLSAIESTDLYEADGILSCVTGTIFGVKLADCNGVILLWSHWYAVVHAGWRGLKAGIIEHAIEMLIAHGEDPTGLSVFCSPSIRVCCYEVGEEFLEYFPLHCSLQGNGKYHFDAISYLRDTLLSHWIDKTNIRIDPHCTCCSKEFYSYRRDKTQNRIAFWVRKMEE